MKPFEEKPINHKRMKDFFPLVLDNTIMSKFAGCEMRAFRDYIQHLSYGQESVHLVFGKAFAEGLEKARVAFYTEGKSHNDSVIIGQDAAIASYGDYIPPERSVKTADKLVAGLEAYFMEWSMENDTAIPVELEGGGHGIEYSFVHELPFKHPTLGIPLMYAGRADMLVHHMGKIWMEDDKTSGQMTSTWARQWETRGQFTGYAWGLKKSGIDVAGALIRGIAIYKTKFSFGETLTSRSNWEIARWEDDTMHRVEQMLLKYERYMNEPTKHASRFFRMDRAEMCNSYMRPCPYMDSCKHPEEEVFLSAEMEQHVWLPHLHERQPLDVFLATLETKGL